jgi:hypothetical protein
MLPEEQEFQILAPGSKTMSLVPENQVSNIIFLP